MEALAATGFEFARAVLQRGIAALYIVALVSTLNQYRALIGEHGILPAPRYLSAALASENRSRLLRPTVFRYLRYSDRRFAALCVAGILAASLVVVGVPQLGPPAAPMACFLVMWGVAISNTSIGQRFYGFMWETLLVESCLLCAFLGSDDQPPPTVTIILFWWLLFRLEFGAGLIKLRRGPEWRDLTAMSYHHETQPMPGPLSRQAHLLPRWFHRCETAANNLVQLVVPWFLAAPLLSQWIPGPVPFAIGWGAAGIIVASQLWLILTGNFAWMNWATLVLAVSAVGIPVASTPDPGHRGGIGIAWAVLTTAVALLYAVLSVPAVRNLISSDQLMNASFNRWQIANAYGAFGSMTRQRFEILIEGTSSGDPAASDWREYAVRGQPGDVRRVPPQVAPYHLRLGWLMWFLALGPGDEPWFRRLLTLLLQADPVTLRLFRVDPFSGQRPLWVRAVRYRYRFATRAEFRRDGNRWHRERVGVVVGPMRMRH